MTTIWQRTNALLLFLVLLALLGVIALLATRASGGSLDPPGAPASTMKSLDDVPGSWSRKLDASNGAAGPNPAAGCDSSRFKCVFADPNTSSYPAVLDLETGLVWERSPDASVMAWVNAHDTCLDRTTGGRRGWRLPTYEELSTLLDPTNGHQLPAGSPFQTPGSVYWTATESGTTSLGYIAVLGASSQSRGAKSLVGLAWCVRGEHGEDVITRD